MSIININSANTKVSPEFPSPCGDEYNLRRGERGDDLDWFPSPCGDEYNRCSAGLLGGHSRFRPLAGMSIIQFGNCAELDCLSFRPLAGMSIIRTCLRDLKIIKEFPSPCGDEYNP